MKSKVEVIHQLDIYKEQLAMAMDEKMLYDNHVSPNIDLIIFSLIDKLETLFWVLEMELPDNDVLDSLSAISH